MQGARRHWSSRSHRSSRLTRKTKRIRYPMTDTQVPAAPCTAPPAKPTVWPHAQGQDAPASLLASWIALEALSPQTYKSPDDLTIDQRTIAPLGSTPPGPPAKNQKGKTTPSTAK
jgi:hypothetical protein